MFYPFSQEVVTPVRDNTMAIWLGSQCGYQGFILLVKRWSLLYTAILTAMPGVTMRSPMFDPCGHQVQLSHPQTCYAIWG